MKFKEDLTIVIPSIGEKSLENTIVSILKNTVLPKIILVILPVGTNFNLKINSDIIKILYSTNKGQVNQRILGFKKTSTKYVMQLDSDIILNQFTIEKLIQFMSKTDGKTAVAPILYPLLKKTKLMNSFFFRFKNYIINKKFILKPGIITDIGYNSWFIEDEIKNSSYEVEWLPGGCILHQRENLVTINYYPFKGKAYCEDVLHCIELSKSKVKLYLYTDDKIINSGININNKFFDKLKEFKVRYYLLKKIKGNIIRFLLWYCMYVIK